MEATPSPLSSLALLVNWANVGLPSITSDIFFEQHEMQAVPEWSAETVVLIGKG